MSLVRARHMNRGMAWACRVALGLATVGPAVAQTQDPVAQRLVLQEMQSGVVITPTFKVTDIDGQVGTMMGVQGGLLTDGRLFVGAGVHWLTGGADNVDLAYGGGVVEWLAASDALVTVSLGSLVGFGSATLGSTLGDFDGPDFRSRFVPQRFRHVDYDRSHGGRPSVIGLRWRETFFVAEPQANLVLHAADWLRVGIGAGYRMIGQANGFEERLRGMTANLSIQLGPQ